ncbi:MAG: glycosyltransferase family A protein [Planctomycetota bacterium]
MPSVPSDGPTVSVIIPTYRHAAYVIKTIESVLGQTFQNFELILVNDGSPDDTAEVVRPIVESDPRIRYVEQRNGGQASARNHGLHLARGEFLAYLDDDDLWPADKLAWQVPLLKSNPGAGFVYGTHELFHPNGRIVPDPIVPRSGQFYDEMLEHWLIRSPGQTLMRASAVREVGGWDESIRGSDDWDLHLRLLQHLPAVGHAALALRYRVHPANASNNYWPMWLGRARLARKHVGRWPRSVHEFGKWRRVWRGGRGHYAQRAHHAARCSAAEGNYGGFWRHLGRAARIDVWSLFKPAMLKTLGVGLRLVRP